MMRKAGLERRIWHSQRVTPVHKVFDLDACSEEELVEVLESKHRAVVEIV